jgi:hypothetical protein
MSELRLCSWCHFCRQLLSFLKTKFESKNCRWKVAYFAFVVCDARFHVELVVHNVGFDCLLRISRKILVVILILVSFEVFCQLKTFVKIYVLRRVTHVVLFLAPERVSYRSHEVILCSWHGGRNCPVLSPRETLNNKFKKRKSSWDWKSCRLAD